MFRSTMNGKSSKHGKESHELGELSDLLADLEREFPVLVAEAAYVGPPAGVFRELDLAHLPPPARNVLTALGRLLWRQFEVLQLQAIGGRLTRRVPPLDVALEAVASELTFAARCLSAAHGIHRATAGDKAGREIGKLGVRSLRRMHGLIQEIEKQLPALRAAREVSDAPRTS
jgi:hypothetical protein